jgi:hypothetical protein
MQFVRITLAEVPDIAGQWHPMRNGDLTPSQILSQSNKRAWWLCNQGHEYEAIIANRVALGRGCPYCSRKRAGYGNDLASTSPGIAAEWHHARNGDLTPAQVLPGSGRKVWWQCPAGHPYDMAVYRRARQGTGCPYCVGRRAGQGNELATLSPDIASQWHPTLNGLLTPADVRPMSNRNVWWQCGQGHDYQAQVCNRVGNGNGCPYCSGHRAGYGNDLSQLSPAVAAEWHPARNGALSPSDVMPKSHQAVWWLCSQCSHQWQAVISSRTSGKGCPACGIKRNSAARRQPTAGRSLADEYPDLAAQWHPGLNGAKTPDTVNAGSSDRAWWQCQDGHAWDAVISNRTKRQGGSGCPYCAGQRATAEHNLARLDPALAAQWHPTRNGDLTPSQVTPNSHKAVWWICNERHFWRALVSSRTRGSGCPDCFLAATSKMEIQIFAELQHVLAGHLEPIEHNPRVLAPPGRKLTVDMSFGDVIIEFDGSYWHTNSTRRDATKTARLVTAGYRIIRIRESPLSRLTGHDVLVPINQSAHLTAVAVLEAMDQWGWLPAEANPAMRVYIQQCTAMAEQAANDIIKARLLPIKGPRASG